MGISTSYEAYTEFMKDIEKTQPSRNKLSSTVGLLANYSLDNAELDLHQRHIRYDARHKKRKKVMSLLPAQANIYGRPFTFIRDLSTFAIQRALRLQLQSLKTKAYRRVQPKRKTCVLCWKRLNRGSCSQMNSVVREEFLKLNPERKEEYLNAIECHQQCTTLALQGAESIKTIMESRIKTNRANEMELQESLIALQEKEQKNNIRIDADLLDSFFAPTELKVETKEILIIDNYQRDSLLWIEEKMLQVCAKKFSDSVEGKTVEGLTILGKRD